MYLWQLILYVNLTGLQGAQTFGQMLILSVIVKVFLDEIKIWIPRLSKADCHSPPPAPANVSGPQPINWRGEWNKKAE